MTFLFLNKILNKIYKNARGDTRVKKAFILSLEFEKGPIRKNIIQLIYWVMSHRTYNREFGNPKLTLK